MNAPVARGLLAGALLLCLTGCSAGLLRKAAAAQPRLEIDQVPYFPQRDHQCGPAALATILTAAGASTSADALTHEVYIAGRKGSLQAELLAAARRHERVAFVLEPTLPALLQELEQARPVLVLQNFGFESWPRWHYAVVVGYDRERDTFLLRSGRHQRQQLAARRFLATWRRAGNWGFVALRPGELPAAANPASFLNAVAALETLGSRDSASLAYQAAVSRWPEEPLAWFALGNNRLALGEDAAAEAAYREVLRIAPAQLPARNNLALLLARRGCVAAARAALEPARVAAGNGAFAAQIADSFHEIEARGITDAACSMH